MVDDFDNSPFVRTDFSDDAAWRSLVEAAAAESPDGFRAELRIVDDRRFEGCSPAELISRGQGWNGAAVLFIADEQTLDRPEQPILCVDLADPPGRSFRCIPSELWGVENNLRIANMDFDEFASSVDTDGVHRGFE
jgi:hypothetical protein